MTWEAFSDHVVHFGDNLWLPKTACVPKEIDHVVFAETSTRVATYFGVQAYIDNDRPLIICGDRPPANAWSMET